MIGVAGLLVAVFLSLRWISSPRDERELLIQHRAMKFSFIITVITSTALLLLQIYMKDMNPLVLILFLFLISSHSIALIFQKVFEI
jgi:hypothetical protein